MFFILIESQIKFFINLKKVNLDNARKSKPPISMFNDQINL